MNPDKVPANKDEGSFCHENDKVWYKLIEEVVQRSQFKSPICPEKNTFYWFISFMMLPLEEEIDFRYSMKMYAGSLFRLDRLQFQFHFEFEFN